MTDYGEQRGDQKLFSNLILSCLASSVEKDNMHSDVFPAQEAIQKSVNLLGFQPLVTLVCQGLTDNLECPGRFRRKVKLVEWKFLR